VRLARSLLPITANILKAALRAERLLAADLLTMMDQKRVIFIEERSPVGQVFHEESLVGGVTITPTASGRQADAVNNTPGVGINNEDGFTSGVEDYGVGGLLANAVNRQKLWPKLFEASGQQLSQVVAIGLAQPLDESLELAGLGVKVAAGSDKSSQFIQAEAA